MLKSDNLNVDSKNYDESIEQVENAKALVVYDSGKKRSRSVLR